MMTKHLYEWAVQGFVSIYCEISDLVDLIQLPHLQTPNPAAMQPHEVRGLFPNTDAMDEEEEESHNGECISDVSTSEVEFCGAKCNCLDCNPAHGLQTDTSLRAQEKKDNLQTGKSPPAEKKTTCRPTSRPQQKKDNLQTDKSPSHKNNEHLQTDKTPPHKENNLQTDKSLPAPEKRTTCRPTSRFPQTRTTCRPTSRPQHQKKDNLQTDKKPAHKSCQQVPQTSWHSSTGFHRL